MEKFSATSIPSALKIEKTWYAKSVVWDYGTFCCRFTLCFISFVPNYISLNTTNHCLYHIIKFFLVGMAIKAWQNSQTVWVRKDTDTASLRKQTLSIKSLIFVINWLLYSGNTSFGKTPSRSWQMFLEERCLWRTLDELFLATLLISTFLLNL